MDIFSIFTEKALHNEPIEAPSWAQNCLHIDWLKSPCWNMKWYVIKISIILFFVLFVNTIHGSFIKLKSVAHLLCLPVFIHSVRKSTKITAFKSGVNCRKLNVYDIGEVQKSWQPLCPHHIPMFREILRNFEKT